MPDESDEIFSAFLRAQMLLQTDTDLNEMLSGDSFMQFVFSCADAANETAQQMVMLVVTGAETLPNGEPMHNHSICTLAASLEMAFAAGMEYANAKR